MRIKLLTHAVVAWRVISGLALSLLTSAVAWLLGLGFAGLACIVGGVAVLFGSGWALIAGGLSLLVMAAFIKRGLTNG